MQSFKKGQMKKKGQKSQEVIDNETQGILYPFSVRRHCQLESCSYWA